MARTTQIILVDDIDGGSAEETVHFGLDGVQYEIDLSKANAAKLRKALAGYVQKARRNGGRRVTRARAGASASSRSRRVGNSDVSAIRAWAHEQGLLESTRGRIPASVVEAYEAAHHS